MALPAGRSGIEVPSRSRQVPEAATACSERRGAERALRARLLGLVPLGGAPKTAIRLSPHETRKRLFSEGSGFPGASAPPTTLEGVEATPRRRGGVALR